MGKCILSGDDTNSQFNLYGQKVFIKREIFNLIAAVLNGDNYDEMKKAFDQVILSEVNIDENYKELVDKLNSTLLSKVNKNKPVVQEEVLNVNGPNLEENNDEDSNNESENDFTEPVDNNVDDEEDEFLVEQNNPNISLLTNEKQIKKWYYATGKIDNESIKETLIITNKRLISESNSKHLFERHEINLKDIVGVSTHYGVVPYPLWKIILEFVIGSLLFIVALSDIITFSIRGVWDMFAIVWLLLSAIAIALGISHIIKKKVVAYSITVTTKANSTGLYIGKSFGKKKPVKKYKIIVDSSCIKEIVTTLGNIIAGLQN